MKQSAIILLLSLAFQTSAFWSHAHVFEKATGFSIAQETGCTTQNDAAQDGTFAVGYTATFETQANGTSVDITFELLDTDKVGVVAFLWRQSPFAEFQMTDLGENRFGITVDDLTNGSTVTYACKFAFAGGLAVTEYIEYVVGEECNVDPASDTRLSDIQVDGASIEEFSSSQLTYIYETDLVNPTVTATTAQEGADLSITQADAVPGTATILVTSIDESATKTYTVEFVGPTNYVLVWSDEFDEDGAVDATNWHHQTQIPIGDSWFNNEVQHYTDRTDNSVVEDGVLKIIAKRETGYTQGGVSKDFTSARLNSKFAFTYGKVDVRAKLPPELGTWPAIWTLGKNISENGAYWQKQGFGTTVWPVTGEIDIMEQFGRNASEKNDIHGSTHTPRSSGATENTASTVISTSTTEFHVYSIIWDQNEIQFLVDDIEYYTYNPTTRYGGKSTNPQDGLMNWPFDEPQYLILNIAMGGILGGTIPASFTEGVMEIDYVRVFQIGQPSLSLETASLSLDENSTNGTFVVEVASNYVGNGTLTYTITTGNEEGVFQINATNGRISVADASKLDFDTNPTYTLTVEVTDGSLVETTTITIQINEIAVLGFDQVNTESLVVYPNPVSATLTLVLEESSEVSLLSVTDLAGRVLTIPMVRNSSSYELDFSSQQPGIYLLILEDRSGPKTLRVRKL